MATSSYVIGIGSNRRHGLHGMPRRVVGAALAALDRGPFRMVAAAPVIETAAMGPAGRRFANGAALIETTLSPPELLVELKAIEVAFGRRRGRRWGPRVLDLDIVMWSKGRWPIRGVGKRGLTVPHAGLAARSFVLAPALVLAPRWRDPVSGRTVRHMHARLRRARSIDGARARS